MSKENDRPSMCSRQEPQKERTPKARCAPDDVQPTFSGYLGKYVSRCAKVKALTISEGAHRTQNK